LPLALDFQQRPGFGGFEPFLSQCTVGTQLVQFRSEVMAGGFKRPLQLMLALLREPYLLLQRRRRGDGDRQRLFPFGDAGVRGVERGRTARQFLAHLVALGVGPNLPGVRLRDRSLRLELRGGQLFLRHVDRPRPERDRQFPGRGL